MRIPITCFTATSACISVMLAFNVLQQRSTGWERDGVARSRYSNSCVWLKTPLSAGMAVTDERGAPLSPGVNVCDSFGATGVIQGGKVTDLATVTNWDTYLKEKLARENGINPDQERRARDPKGSYYQGQ